MDNNKTSSIIDSIVAISPVDQQEGVRKYFSKPSKKSEADNTDEVMLSCDDMPGNIREIVVQMLRKEYELWFAERQAKLAKKRWDLVKNHMYLEIGNLIDFTEGDGDVYFDRTSYCVRVGSKSSEVSTSSVEQTIDEYIDLVTKALNSPVTAGTMACDSRLPYWLRAFSSAIIESGLRKGLRREVEKAIQDPVHAKMWASTAREDGMEEWIADMFDMLAMAKIY